MRTEKLTSAYVCVMLSVFLLFTGSGGYYWLARKKFVFLAAATLAWLIPLIWASIKDRKSVQNQANDTPIECGQKKPRNFVIALILLYAVPCTVSTLLSRYPVFIGWNTGRYNGLVTYLLYAVIFAGVYFFGRLKEHQLLLFFTAYSLCCVIALLQFAGFNPLNLYPDGLNFHDPYIQQVFCFLGTIGNVDILSSLNCLAIPAAICSITHISPGKRFIPVIAAILGFGAAAAAGVMSGFVGLGVTAVVYLFIAAIGRRYEARVGDTAKENAYTGHLRLLIPAAALVLLATACLISVFILPDETGSSRILIWKSSLKVFRQHMFLGIGPDCLSNYSTVSFSRYSPELGRELTCSLDNAHCELLHHLLSFGLAGLVPLAAAALTFGRKVSAHYLAPALFCYAVQSFFNLGLPLVTPVFVIFLALCAKGNDMPEPENMIE